MEYKQEPYRDPEHSRYEKLIVEDKNNGFVDNMLES